MRRRAGELIRIEHDILQALANLERDGRGRSHGFLIASHMSADGRSHRLASHGTLYRALDRLERWGFVTSEWEDPHLAAEAGRPRRRSYELTTTGRAVAADAGRAAMHVLRSGRVRA